MKNTFFVSIVTLTFCFIAHTGYAQDNSVETVKSTTEEDSMKDEILKAYAWTKAHLENNSVVAIKQMKTVEGHEFVLVESNESKTLYDREGKRYCADHENLNCVEFYKLNVGNLEWKRS